MADVVADKVIVELEAQTQKYLSDLNKADTAFTAIAARVQAEAAHIANAMSQISARDIRSEDLRAYGAALDALREKYDPLFAASRNYERELEELNQAHAVGAIDARVYAEAVARLDTRYDELANGAKRAAAAQEEAARASQNHVASMGQADLSLQRLIDVQTGAASATKEWSGPLGNLGQELDGLRAKFVPLFAAQQRYASAVDEINRAERLGAITAVEAANARNLEAQSFQKLTTAAAGARGAISNMNVGNIAAQFQDVGVTAAMGMNPMIVALQQGTQLSAVLNQSVANGVSPVRMLGQAFAQIINPISLATIAAVALTTAAIQYFMTIATDGRMSNEELKKQEGIIRDVAKRWGEAIPALKAYVDQLDRAKEGDDLSQVRGVLEADIWDDLRGKIGDWRAELAAARIDMQAFGADAQEIDQLQSSFDRLAAKVADGSASVEDLESLMKILSATAGSNVIPSLVALQGVLSGLAAQLRDAASAQNELNQAFAADSQISVYNKNADFIAEQERVNSLTSEQLTLEREIARVKADADRSDTLISDQQALDIATQRLAAEERRRKIAEDERKGEKAGSKLATEAEREAKAVLEFIEALEHEYRMLTLTNEEKAVANALRQAGAAATEKQQQYIERLVVSMEQERQVLGLVQDGWNAMGNAADDVLDQIIDQLFDANAQGIDFGKTLRNLAKDFLKLGLQSFGAGIQGGGFNPLGFLFGGFRANGGPVAAGTSYVVGERGPELFTPSTSGMITPNGGGAQQMALTVHVVSDDEKFSAYVTDRAGSVVAQAAPAIVAGSVQQANKSAPSALAHYQSQRGGSDYRT